MSKHEKDNTHTRIVRALFTGAKTRAELVEAGGGQEIETRVYELNKMYSDIQIVKVADRFELRFLGRIKIDRARVYPNQRKAKAFG